MEISYEDAIQMVIDNLQTIEIKATENNLHVMSNCLTLLRKVKETIANEMNPFSRSIEEVPPLPGSEAEDIDVEVIRE